MEEDQSKKKLPNPDHSMNNEIEDPLSVWSWIEGLFNTEPPKKKTPTTPKEIDTKKKPPNKNSLF